MVRRLILRRHRPLVLPSWPSGPSSRPTRPRPRRACRRPPRRAAGSRVSHSSGSGSAWTQDQSQVQSINCNDPMTTELSLYLGLTAIMLWPPAAFSVPATLRRARAETRPETRRAESVRTVRHRRSPPVDFEVAGDLGRGNGDESDLYHPINPICTIRSIRFVVPPGRGRGPDRRLEREEPSIEDYVIVLVVGGGRLLHHDGDGLEVGEDAGPHPLPPPHPRRLLPLLRACCHLRREI